MFDQLSDLVPSSCDAHSSFKAKTVDLANQVCVADPGLTGVMSDHRKALEEVRKGDDVVISRPDKGSGAVIMNEQDYIQKMQEVISDRNRFVPDRSGRGRTATVKQSITRELRQLHKDGHISSTTLAQFIPRGSRLPRIYGFSKVHKDGIPLQPILFMIGAPHQS
ncbi:unnamed protein product [Echinostoma caproni]|uniref:H15 domain-containing protein n=1 Tax=Echinostoma caproni TaxID=27848 RepID=A0A183AC09_9TREM|nr:unnamed protein product [Echinostoma caproni]